MLRFSFKNVLFSFLQTLIVFSLSEKYLRNHKEEKIGNTYRFLASEIERKR